MQKKELLREQALEYHSKGLPGKIEFVPTKEAKTQRDLSLAYSPGVAEPCKEIYKNVEDVYKYTAKGNLVAVITNGTAVLGLGDIGPEASKPVMEGKGVLFKIFADIDVFEIEINETDPVKFVQIVKALEPTFGGINLEDIKAPECFYIERELRKRMNIPVFHDDQHGTAIIVGAAILNGIKIVGKNIRECKLVVSGAGAAALACLDLIVDLGFPVENIWVTDLAGVVYSGRVELMDPDKARFAQPTEARSLSDIIVGADIFLGLSAGGVLKQEMVMQMAARPLILALANPTPEILPEEVKAVRSDAVIATGRSDYPNQVNNVLCFPYIFRGALDVRAKTINEEMKIAAARALAELAREDVPDEVAAAYRGARPEYGPEYIIPVPFDPRLISRVSRAVAEAAMKSGVARKEIKDLDAYSFQLSARLDPSAALFQRVTASVRANPKRVVFAEGEEESVIRAAAAFQNSGLGKAFLVGREDVIKTRLKSAGVEEG